MQRGLCIVSFSLLNKLDLAISTALLLSFDEDSRKFVCWHACFTGRESKLEFSGTSASSGYLIPEVVLSNRKFLSFEFSVGAWCCPWARWE